MGSEWDASTFDVRDKMARRVCSSVTPLTKSADGSRGAALGTGNYVLLEEGRGLVTNRHVVEEVHGSAHLAHLPVPGECYVACRTFMTEPWPIDLAVGALPPEAVGSDRFIITAREFDENCSPVDGEFLFFLGFPGTTAGFHDPITQSNTRYSWFGTLESLGVPMLTQALVDVPPNLSGYQDSMHIAIHLPATAPKVLGGPPEDLPNPNGESGSLLWDTKFVATQQEGGTWTPDKARICGLLWGVYPTLGIAVATTVEHFLPDIRRMLRTLHA